MEGFNLSPISAEIISCDFLIVGGGSAGTMAAIRAKECDPHAKIVIFEKSDISFSGSIANGMDAFNVAVIPGFSTAEDYVRTAHRATRDIVDDSQCYAWVSRTYEMVQRLESWGVHFPKDSHGQYTLLNTPPKGRFCLALKEPRLKKILSDRVYESGVHVYNHTMAIELLQQNGHIVGVVGLHTQTQEPLICLAKAVLLCSGGTARFGQTTNGYPYGTFDFPGNTGEAYRMAYDAGAELTGFEHTIVDYSVKDINTAGLHISCTRGAVVKDAFNQDVEGDQLSISNLLMIHNQGRGPLRVQMEHLPEEKIQEIEQILFTTERPVQQRFFQNRHIDFRFSDIEQWPSECFLCGGHSITGIRVDGKAQSSIAGLYAAGDAANVRGFLPGALVMGCIAAENAIEYVKNQNDFEISPDLWQPSLEKLLSIQQLNGPVSVQEFESKLRRTITDYIAPPKNEYKLNRAIQEVHRMWAEHRQIIGLREPSDLYKYYELESILISALLSATASKERKESRWGINHLRTDFPERDDENWIKHIILKKGTEELSVQVSLKDVERMDLGE